VESAGVWLVPANQPMPAGSGGLLGLTPSVAVDYAFEW
jgi:hypothetical protein